MHGEEVEGSGGAYSWNDVLDLPDGAKANKKTGLFTVKGVKGKGCLIPFEDTSVFVEK